MFGIDARLENSRSGIGKYVFDFTREALHRWGSKAVAITGVEKFSGYKRQIQCPVSLTSHPKVELWESLVLPKYLKSVDLLYSPGNRLPLSFSISKKNLTCFLHDAMTAKFPEFYPIKFRAFSNLMLRQSLQRADLVFTNSECSKRDLLNNFSFKFEKKIFVNPLWVDPIQAASSASAFKKPYFLHIGTLEPRKNHLGILRAIEILPEKIRNNFAFVFVGGRGWKYKNIESELLRLCKKYPASVFYLESRSSEEVRSLLQSSFSVLFPSLYEGFGYPILEGFSARKPVITSFGSATEEVSAGATLLVHPKEPESISEKIQQLCESDDLCRQLIGRGTERLASFSIEKHFRTFEQTLRDKLNFSFN